MYYNSRVSVSRRHLIVSAAAIPFAARSFARRPKVVVAGGHPGDPECGYGGTIARYSDEGSEVVLLYLNRGEGSCGAAPLDRCADIRTAEAQRACRILKARTAFAGQYDGRSIVDAERYEHFGRILLGERPDIVFTHWPIDRHRDHRAISLLTLDAWWKAGKPFSLYYYEVAEDTTMFTPAEYVDISRVEAHRRNACFAHVSQQPAKWYPKQVEITRQRGKQAGSEQAEAFVRHPESSRAQLPKTASHGDSCLYFDFFSTNWPLGVPPRRCPYVGGGVRAGRFAQKLGSKLSGRNYLPPRRPRPFCCVSVFCPPRAACVLSACWRSRLISHMSML
jgi:LmbE family N-acetylglucosaminyl deacetylase